MILDHRSLACFCCIKRVPSLLGAFRNRKSWEVEGETTIDTVISLSCTAMLYNVLASDWYKYTNKL